METLSFRICVVLGLLAGAVIVALPLRRQFADFHEFVHRTPKWQRAFLALLAAVFIAYGSTKTNQVSESESEVAIERSQIAEGLREQWNLPTCSAGQPEQEFNLLCSTSTSDYDYHPPTVTPAEIACGWQLVGIDTNAAVDYAMPAGAVLASNWWVRGAFDDVAKIGLGGWRFPFGTNEHSSLWAFTWGKARFRFDDTNEITVVSSPMSAVPYRSRLWTLETNNAFLVTWENFAFNRDTNTPINAQLELHRSGDFVTRSNAVEIAYRRVCQEDWDDDGIPNVRDPHPYSRDGDFFGLRQTLPDEANEDAYCWVEIVADVNTHVVFTGDGESDLPDPDFMIRAGETNRVTLLIGKTYTVESTQPLAVTDRSDGAIEVSGNGSCALSVVWPVTVYAMEGNGASFMMRVVPNRIGGEFVWDDDCCPITGSGRVFSWGCNGLCLCTGCTAQGVLVYEGYSISVTGGHCGCAYGPRQAETEPDDDQMVAGVSASFSPEAIIFEDAYTNMPGEVVGRRSTEAVLSCAIHGGFRGGTATFSFAGETNLVWIRGAAVPQSTVTISPGEKLEFAAVYEGQRPSAETEDITYTVTFTENDTTNGPTIVQAELTSFKVELEASHTAIENPNRNRHVFGVGEEAVVKCLPTSNGMRISASQGLMDEMYNGSVGFVSSAEACTTVITIECENAQKEISIDVFEPEGYEVASINATFREMPGEAGLIDLFFTNRLIPLWVSFYAVQVMEIPMVSTDAVGYFAQPEFADDLDHGKRGAYGQWSTINEDNSTSDNVSMALCPKPWNGGGSYTWPIPNAWRVVDYLFATNVFTHTDQRFELDADGTARVSKFGWTGERGTNDTHRVYEGVGR